jgi:hypothetical protein
MRRSAARLVGLAWLVSWLVSATAASAQPTPPQPQPPPAPAAIPTVEQSLAQDVARGLARRGGAQPGTSSVTPLTEAVLVGSQEDGAASARVGFITKWLEHSSLAYDVRLTNKPPKEGLPVLSGLEGLDDGAEVSIGIGVIRSPDGVVKDAKGMRDACDTYYARNPDRRPANYEVGSCEIDADTEGDTGLLRAMAPFVKSGWAYAAQARIALSRPQFEYRPTLAESSIKVRRQEHSFKLSGSVLTPANVGPSRAKDMMGAWFMTFDFTVGDDWEGHDAENVCTQQDNGVIFKCQNVAVGEPFEQHVRTIGISARRYFSEWIAVAPAWSRRWSDRVDGEPSESNGRWSFDLPVYFLKDPDEKGLTGGVAVSWVRGAGRRYVVFVGAVLPPFEF